MEEIKHEKESSVVEGIESDFRNCDEHYSGIMKTYRDAIRRLENPQELKPHTKKDTIGGAKAHGTRDGEKIVQRLLGYVEDGQLSAREAIDLLDREIKRIEGIIK